MPAQTQDNRSGSTERILFNGHNLNALPSHFDELYTYNGLMEQTGQPEPFIPGD